MTLSAGGIVYALFVLKALGGIQKLRRMSTAPSVAVSQTISIVIAARNEEEWIGKTLESLLAQRFAKSQQSLQIVVVDDRSTDRTAEIAAEFVANYPQLRLIRQTSVPPNVSPKKAALALGIANSSGEVILLTDADCLHDPGWAEQLTASLLAGSPTSFAGRGEDNPGMSIGQARFIVPNDAPLWQRLQALDFAAQGVLSAGLVAAGTPYNCCGASLAFTREAFDRVGGWDGLEQFISGDDELLMRRFVAHGIPVVAAMGVASVVQTRPPANLSELWHQRARWGSKTLHYPAGQKAVLTGIFLFYLALALTPFFSCSWGLFSAATGAFSVKFLVDLFLLIASRPLYGDQIRLGEFFLAELLHPPVIVALAILGAFGSFDWKGTTYKTKATT